MYLSNISYDIRYDLTKFELITQLLCGETKKKNLIKGQIGSNKRPGGVN